MSLFQKLKIAIEKFKDRITFSRKANKFFNKGAVSPNKITAVTYFLINGFSGKKSAPFPRPPANKIIDPTLKRAKLRMAATVAPTLVPLESL